MSIVESAIMEGTLTLEGVWLHRPTDPAGTAKNYRFGSNQRGASHQSFSALTRFAGREFPVADFAKYHDQVYSVTVDVPHGETWAQDITDLYELESSHDTLAFRDNRGRSAFCTLTGLTESDQGWGTQISFEVTKVDYVLETV